MAQIICQFLILSTTRELGRTQPGDIIVPSQKEISLLLYIIRLSYIVRIIFLMSSASCFLNYM